MTESTNDATTSTLPSSSNEHPLPRQLDLELVLSPAAFSSLVSELGKCPLDQLENDCRLLAKRTVEAAIELGKRLLIIKSRLSHGQWMESVVRIGMESSYARKFMQAAIRVSNLGGLPVLTHATGSQTKLFQLLALNDADLVSLDAGETVRGISASILPEMTAVRLGEILRENALAKTLPKALALEGLTFTETPAMPPEVAPILGGKPEPEPAQSFQPLQPGDRIKSIHTGREGSVVRTYSDGSACVLWDDGEPQEAGLGHERMPRTLLVYVEPEAPETENNNSTVDAPEAYPVVYNLIPGNYNGTPVTVIDHEGQHWMINEEIARVLGKDDHDRWSLKEFMGVAFMKKYFSEGTYMRAQLGTSRHHITLLNPKGIECLCLSRDGDDGKNLSNWLSQNFSPDQEKATITLIDNARPKLTLKQSLNRIRNVDYEFQEMLYLVEAQIMGIGKIVDARDSRDTLPKLGSLIDIAAKLIAPFEDILERRDDALSDLKKKLFRTPDDGQLLPESVWLDLVAELVADHEGGFTNDQMAHLADIVDSMTRNGSDSPEVAAAVPLVVAFADRHGAVLYDHTYEGETQEEGRVAFRWKPGVEQQRQKKVRESFIAH